MTQVVETHHITIATSVVHITDLLVIASHADHIHIIPYATIQIVMAAASNQPVPA